MERGGNKGIFAANSPGWSRVWWHAGVSASLSALQNNKNNKQTNKNQSHHFGRTRRKPSGPSCSKPDYPNPGLSRNFPANLFLNMRRILHQNLSILMFRPERKFLFLFVYAGSEWEAEFRKVFDQPNRALNNRPTDHLNSSLCTIARRNKRRLHVKSAYTYSQAIKVIQRFFLLQHVW